jgi:hypothetical protein
LIVCVTVHCRMRRRQFWQVHAYEYIENPVENLQRQVQELQSELDTFNTSSLICSKRHGALTCSRFVTIAILQ